LAGGTKILQEMIGDSTFADLRIPFAVTAVDINACQTLEIRSGRVLDAVLATIAVPGILPARRWGDRLLVDGGVANPVPVDLVRKLRPELPVLAVVLTEKNNAAPNLTVPIPEFPGAAPVVDYISRLRFAQALNVFVKSIDVGGKFLADIRLELDKPDLIIRPDVGEIGLLDNIDIDQVAKLGEDAAYTNLDKINKISSLGYRIQKIWSKR
jgi:NTE family protein